MRSLIGFILLLSITTILSGQTKSFDERYNEVYHQVFTSGPGQSLGVADSLYHVAIDDEQRMKALMLLGTIYHGLGDVSEALFHVTKAQEIAKTGRYLDWQARTTGFLANTYRVIGLLEEARNGFEEAEKINENQKQSPSYFLTKANILQERAHIAMDESNYILAVDFLKQADTYISQDRFNPERAKIVKSMNLEMQGVCFLYQDEVRTADSVLNLAKKSIESEKSMVLPYVYRARAESALRRGEYDSAYHYLELTLPFLPSSQDLEIHVYDSYAKYYNALEHYDQAMHYLGQKQDIEKLRLQNANKIVNEFIRKLNEDNQSYQKEIELRWWALIGMIFLFGLVLVFLWIKRRRGKAKYIQMIEHLQTRNTLPRASSEFSQEEQVEEPEKSTKGLLISKDTELRLLSALEKLEETAFFLEKDISLASLSLLLHTNQRYVSHIIRKYRDKDFNSYIQHYRITYIINRVRMEPELLDYKLSYLADLAGFSSHSKFSAVFKSVTGLPPSVFIHYTKEEVKKNKPITS